MDWMTTWLPTLLLVAAAGIVVTSIRAKRVPLVLLGLGLAAIGIVWLCVTAWLAVPTGSGVTLVVAIITTAVVVFYAVLSVWIVRVLRQARREGTSPLR